MLHPKTDEHPKHSVEVHHLVGKLSTAETLLTDVQRKVPTCPGGLLVINVCNHGKNLCSPCICNIILNLDQSFQKQNCYSFIFTGQNTKGRGSSVGTANCYELDGPGIEYRRGAKFSSPFQTDPGAHPAPYIMITGSFLGGKAAEAWRRPLTSN